jgi:two-component system, LuxR family, response regulator FixJ
VADALVVHVVDDDPAVRDSLALLLQSAGMSVCVYDSAAALLSVASKLDAGCVLTDVRMP